MCCNAVKIIALIKDIIDSSTCKGSRMDFGRWFCCQLRQVGSLTVLVPSFLGVQVTRCPRNYHLNLFESCLTIVIVDHGL